MINNDVNLQNILKEDIYYNNTVLEKMEKLRIINKENPEKLREAKLICPEYNKLYQDIISVGII